MSEASTNKPGKTVHESTYSLAWKILLLQVLIALLSMVIIALLRIAPPITGITPALNFSLLSLMVAVQTLDATLLLYLVISWRSIRYRITPQEIVINHGILDVNTEIYKTASIEKVEVRQSVLGKLFNYGTVSFFNPALGARIEMMNIPNPEYYARLIGQPSQS